MIRLKKIHPLLIKKRIGCHNKIHCDNFLALSIYYFPIKRRMLYLWVKTHNPCYIWNVWISDRPQKVILVCACVEQILLYISSDCFGALSWLLLIYNLYNTRFRHDLLHFIKNIERLQEYYKLMPLECSTKKKL